MIKNASLLASSLLAVACQSGGIDPDSNPTKDEVRAQGKADGGHDFCEALGWYGDGVCDDFCPSPDPDCDTGSAGGGSTDICAVNDWYGDKYCDSDCEYRDSDCDDPCVTNNWYGDGVCDPDVYSDPSGGYCYQYDTDCG